MGRLLAFSLAIALTLSACGAGAPPLPEESGDSGANSTDQFVEESVPEQPEGESTAEAAAEPSLSPEEIMEQVRDGSFLIEGAHIGSMGNDPGGLDGWLGEYAYVEQWPGAYAGSFNRGLDYSILIYREEDLVCASLSTRGWMSDFVEIALVLGGPDSIDLYFLYEEWANMPSSYEPGELLLSFHREEQELFTTYHGFLLVEAGSSGPMRSFTKKGDPTPYEETTGFINEINYIKQDGKWGHIHRDGTVVEPAYDEIYWYITAHAMARVGDRYAVLDKHGNQVYGLGPCAVYEHGEMVDLASFDFRESDSREVILFQLDGKYGQLSPFHWVLLLPEYESVGEFQGERAVVKGTNGLYGVVNDSGWLVVPMEYESPAEAETAAAGE